MSKRRFYILYSLIVPVLYILFAFVIFKFGTTTHEYSSRPFGIVSDIIANVIDWLFLLLIVFHIVLYHQNKHELGGKDKAMMISNTIIGFLAQMFANQSLVIVAYMIALFMGGIFLVIAYVVLYLLQLRELFNEENY